MTDMVHRKNTKRVFLIILMVMAIVIGLIMFRILNPSVGFAYYEPSYLPPNVSIKARRISINSVMTSVEQNFRTVDWVYEIQEYKADSSIGTAQQNYDPTSIQPTCSILTTPEHQTYRLCHYVDYGRISNYEVIFIKNGTYIRSNIPTDLGQRISTQQISRYVDSFKEKSTTGLPVLRSNV